MITGLPNGMPRHPSLCPMPQSLRKWKVELTNHVKSDPVMDLDSASSPETSPRWPRTGDEVEELKKRFGELWPVKIALFGKK
jgi:hypothetical protein